MFRLLHIPTGLFVSKYTNPLKTTNSLDYSCYCLEPSSTIPYASVYSFIEESTESEIQRQILLMFVKPVKGKLLNIVYVSDRNFRFSPKDISDFDESEFEIVQI